MMFFSQLAQRKIAQIDTMTSTFMDISGNRLLCLCTPSDIWRMLVNKTVHSKQSLNNNKIVLIQGPIQITVLGCFAMVIPIKLK